MNQILSTNMPNDKGRNYKKEKIKNPVETSKILKIFAIFLIIFGVFIIGTGAYVIYTNQAGEVKETAKPTITLENKTDTTVLLKVLGQQKNIQKVEYGWNDETKQTIQGNNGKYIEKEINIPSGKNTLNILVTDEDGEEVTYQKDYETQSNINFEVSGNKIKITCESEQTISYMTYRWDDEDETTIQINDTKVEQEIDAKKGTHTLKVIVVDIDNKTDTKEQTIKGVSKPKVIIDTDDAKEHYTLSASDEVGLTKIEIRLNQDDSQKFVINIDNKTEFDCTLPMELQTGDNIIEVTVYNVDGITEYRAAKVTK